VTLRARWVTLRARWVTFTRAQALELFEQSELLVSRVNAVEAQRDDALAEVCWRR
jgi:hypothetical protein